MPQGRMMPEMILLPNGQVLIINGGATGYAAVDSIGVPFGPSNAANPMCVVLTMNAETKTDAASVARLYFTRHRRR
jgi:hypothetical protein